MWNSIAEENQRLKEELADLRQSILRVEPAVLMDGRFEQMITTPICIIAVARQLIDEMPAIRRAVPTPGGAGRADH